MIKEIIVVGGGTAGWLSASIIAANYRTQENPDVRVTLIESPDVATIGVGEGTWPTMRSTLESIGISETEFIRTCGASFKQGSTFVGWNTGDHANDFYHHPFTVPVTHGESTTYSVWKSEYSDMAFSDVANIQGQACNAGIAPKQHTMPEYAGALNYGYHLDAGKFSELLKNNAIANLKVKHVLDHLVEIENDEFGNITTLKTKQGAELKGDFFIDCSGARSLLLGQHFQVPYVNRSKYSQNDTALAVQIPYPEDDTPIASSTIATAHSAGWTWDIGLYTRRGVGYVYSSSHIGEDEARDELRSYIAKSIGQDKACSLEPRKITITPGHREVLWKNNCVAVGMAAGFIEPLEASALALVELSAKMIRDELPMSTATMPLVCKRFNDVFSYRWDRVIEFLRLHYVLSKRRDTAYWRDVTDEANSPESLRDLLAMWANRPPYHHDLLHTEEIFPSASYQYVLYGMGFETLLSAETENDRLSMGVQKVRSSLDGFKKFQSALPSNRKLIDAIYRCGMAKV